MCFILCGIAGREAWLGGPATGTPLAKLDLLVRRRDGALSRMSGQLAAKLRSLNRALTVGTADYSVDWIRLTRRGAFAGGPTAKFADPEDTRKARERLLRDLGESGAGPGSLTADLQHEKQAVRIEALLHPQFLLESVRCRDLEAALDLCHLRTALVVGLKTESGRTGSEPARDLRGLLDLMEGLATPRWEGGAKGETGRSRVMPLKAHVLLEAGDDDLALMARLLPEMPGRFLWLASPAGVVRAARPQLDPNAASTRLIEGFVQASMEILGLRRAGEFAAFGGPDDGLLFAKYHRKMDRYRRWVGALGNHHQLDPGPVLCELPGVLVFGLGYLCGHTRMAGEAVPTSVEVMVAAFRAARRLARRHCGELGLFLNAERVKQGLELAWTIASRLDDKGPLTRRELVRGFSSQCWQRYEPVIGALIGLGVLAWQEDGKLAAGEVESPKWRTACARHCSHRFRRSRPAGTRAKQKRPGKPGRRRRRSHRRNPKRNRGKNRVGKRTGRIDDSYPGAGRTRQRHSLLLQHMDHLPREQQGPDPRQPALRPHWRAVRRSAAARASDAGRGRLQPVNSLLSARLGALCYRYEIATYSRRSRANDRATQAAGQSASPLAAG